MWNYNLILPECVIISTFLVFYFTQPRLPIRINRAFIYIIVIDLLTLLIDIISTYCLEHFCDLHPLLLKLQNIFFFILFLQRTLCFLMFTTIILNKDIRTFGIARFFILIPTIVTHVLLILNLFFDSIFIISDSGQYSQGPLPSKAIREQIASALDLIVQQTRLPDGSRKIVQISEVTGREGDVVLLQDIFVFEQEGMDKDGKVVGHHTATGNIPYFVDELRKTGRLKLDMSVFVPKN